MTTCCNHYCNQGRTCHVRQQADEAARVAADLRIAQLKDSGELQQREFDRALQLQRDDVTRWPD